MDTITQGILGAVCGQVVGGRQLGHRALVWGAMGGFLPDTDTALSLLGPLAEWKYHRSLTHSLWFGPVVGAGLGLALWRRYRGRGAAVGPGPWIAVLVTALFTHPLLDLFTTYGTQLLWPFSRRRFALDAVAIIDLGYTAVLAVALAMAARRPRARATSVACALALLFTTGYLFHGLRLNQAAEAEARRQLATEGLAAADVHAYPTLLQPWLRRVVVRAGEDVRVGLLSMWRPGPIAWSRFRQPGHPAIEAARRTPEGRLFEWFAMGQTAAWVRPVNGGQAVEIEDLRFGYGEGPEDALWGIRIVLDEEGRVRGRVARFNRRPPGVAQVLSRLWQATFHPPPAGRPSAVVPWL